MELLLCALERRGHGVCDQLIAFQRAGLLDAITGCGVNTFCAPPTVWRMLITESLCDWKVRLRELASAGEPLNPEVIEQVRAAWGLTIRDGYGQTETTAQVGNPPGQKLKVGAMGTPAARISRAAARCRGQGCGRRRAVPAARSAARGADARLPG